MTKLYAPHHNYDELVLWLDGSDPNANGGLTTPQNGSAVYSWKDKSKNRYHFEQSTAADMPTYDTTNKRVNFDGSEHLSCLGLDTFPAQNFHIFIAGALDYVAGDGQTDTMMAATTAGGAGDWTFVTEYWNSGAEVRSSFTYSLKTVTAGNVTAAAAISTAQVEITAPSHGLPSGTIVNLASFGTSGGININGNRSIFGVSNDTFKVNITGMAGSETFDTSSATINATGSDSAAATFNAGDNVDAIFEGLGGTGEIVATDVNSRNVYAVGTLTGNFLSSCDLHLMRNAQSSVQEAKGHIYEVLIYRSLRTSAQRNAIQGYLKHKYSMPDAVLQPGFYDDGSAKPFHPFLSNPPQPNTELVTNPTTGASETLPDYFDGLHKLSPRTPVQIVRLSLSCCDNVFGVNNGSSSTCTAAPASEPCYNTRETCTSLNTYRSNTNGLKQLYFISETSRSVGTQISHAQPCLMSVTSAPVEIVPTVGVSLRGSVQIKLRDFMSVDTDVDPYYATRNVIAVESGTYFSKLLSRNPHYVGRTVEVFDGYQDLDGRLHIEDGRKEYIIDSMFLDNGVCSIKCKDPMTLADELKAKVPAPSGFTLKTALAATGASAAHILQVNGQDATATQYQDTFGTSGFARIGKEIIAYTRLSTDASINFIELGAARSISGQWGTTPAAHSENSSVQHCIHFGTYDGSGVGVTMNDVAYELLVNQAGVPAKAISNVTGELYSWADEKTNWLSTFRIDTILSQPKEVNKQLSQIGSMVGVNFFYDDLATKIIMKAETPEIDTESIVRVTDDVIVNDSFKLINAEKDRISRVYYYYNLRDGTEDFTKPKNYKNVYINIDADSEGANEYGVQANKSVFAWGVRDSSTATSVSQRLLNRFRKTPLTCSFEIDSSFDQLSTGQHFYLTTSSITDFRGVVKPSTEMQVLSKKFDTDKQVFIIKAKQFRFGTLNRGKIVSNQMSLTTPGTGYEVGDNLTFTGGSGSNFTCTVTEIKKLGQWKGSGAKAAGEDVIVDTTAADIFFSVGDKIYSDVEGAIGLNVAADITGNAQAKGRGYAIVKQVDTIDGAFEQTLKLDCDIVQTDNDAFYALSTATSSGTGGVSQFNITNAGSGYTENDVLTENSGVNGAGTDCQLTFARTPATFIQVSAGTGTENDPYTGQRSQESFASSDNLLPTVNGGARSRGFIDLTILDGGSGFADSSDVTFSGTDITGSSGTGLSFRAVVSGNQITQILEVTSNPATGSNYDDYAGGSGSSAAHVGYTQSEEVTIDDGTGSGAVIKIQVNPKMSNGSEPYSIV